MEVCGELRKRVRSALDKLVEEGWGLEDSLGEAARLAAEVLRVLGSLPAGIDCAVSESAYISVDSGVPQLGLRVSVYAAREGDETEGSVCAAFALDLTELHEAVGVYAKNGWSVAEKVKWIASLLDSASRALRALAEEGEAGNAELYLDEIGDILEVVLERCESVEGGWEGAARKLAEWVRSVARRTGLMEEFVSPGEGGEG